VLACASSSRCRGRAREAPTRQSAELGAAACLHEAQDDSGGDQSHGERYNLVAHETRTQPESQLQWEDITQGPAAKTNVALTGHVTQIV